MQLEVGKVYWCPKARHGRGKKVGPLELRFCPVCGKQCFYRVGKNSGYHWNSDGSAAVIGKLGPITQLYLSPPALVPEPIFEPGIEYSWGGGDCPVAPDTLVNIQFGNFSLSHGKRADVWNWKELGEYGIISFMVCIPD